LKFTLVIKKDGEQGFEWHPKKSTAVLPYHLIAIAIRCIVCVDVGRRTSNQFKYSDHNWVRFAPPGCGYNTY
jgi:hypothetical protein